jgi:hypothetical protein
VAMKIQVVSFWVMTPCSDGGYRRFGELEAAIMVKVFKTHKERILEMFNTAA